MPHLDTTVLILTYGNRMHLLKKVYDRAREINVRHIIIVDNGVTGESKEYISSIAEQDGTSIIRNYENLGSAGGISIGILYFMSLNIDYLWILDDDNLPAIDSLDHIKNHSELYDTDYTAFHSVRIDSKNQSASARKIPRSTFYEFSLVDIIDRFRKLALIHKEVEKEVFYVDYAPYGGILLSRNLIKKIGLPLKDMYLYVDDTEYTWRINNMGGKIIYVTSSIINDIDDNWGNKYPKPSFFNQFLLEESFFRGYYSIRNHAFFDKYFWRKNNGIYLINRLLFLSILFVLALAQNRIDRFFLVLRAIKQGERRNLGRIEI